MPIKLAANLSFLFKEHPIAERFQAAASAGFLAVELGPEFPSQCSKEELLAAKEKAGVDVVVLCTPTTEAEKGFAALSGREADFKKSLDTAVEYALLLSCTKVHVLAGVVTGDRGKAEQTYVSNLRLAAHECTKHGITVLIEAITTIPGYFLQTQQQAVDIVRAVAGENVKIEFDVFHAQTRGGNLTHFLENNMSLIGHVQVAQVPGRHEPDSEGELNLPYLFRTLQRCGYDGWVGAEYVPLQRTIDGLAWATAYLTVNTHQSN